MVRIHPGQPNKQKRPIERSAFSVCLGACPGAKRPDPTPCAARCGRQPSPATSPRLTARPLVLQGGCFTRERVHGRRQADAGPQKQPASGRHYHPRHTPHKTAASAPVPPEASSALAAPLRQPADLRGGHPLPETTKARPKPGFCVPPSGIPKDPTPGAMDQRLENWVARRALCRPTFLRSTSRASRVMKPALRSSDFRVSSYSISARAMPRRIAPA